MSERVGDWMQTATGRQFWPLDPRAEEVDVRDIAHALANQCRYGGHTKDFYSVAQHSVIVSKAVPPEYARWGLLHDAAEAYFVDIPKPIKRYPALYAILKPFEEGIMRAVCERFGLAPEEPEIVHVVDVDDAVLTERRDVLGPGPGQWRERQRKPLADVIEPWAPERAHLEFLLRFAELWNIRYAPGEAVAHVRSTRPGAFRIPPDALRAVSALDDSLRFAPKPCREAMLLARAALGASGIVARALAWSEHAPVVERVVGGGLTSRCSCGAVPPAGVDADYWVVAHVAEMRGA